MPSPDTISRFSPRRAFARVPAFILNRPWVVLTVVVMASLVFVWPLNRLRFKTTVYDLVIEKLPEKIRYDAFRAVFGSDEIIRIVVKADDIFSPAAFDVISRLAGQAAQIDGIRRVISLADIKKTVDRGGNRSLDAFKALLEPVKLFKRNLISPDRTATAITLVLAADAENAAVVSAVQKFLDKLPPGLSAYQIGMPLVSEALATYSAADFLRIPPISLVIIALLLAVLFRNFICLALPLASVILAQVWTFGLMAWLNISLSMLTMIVPVFLIAVGTAYCMHICSDYLRTAATAVNSRAAVAATFSKLAFPTVLAVATTVTGLGSLALNRIHAIREFAVFSCFGMISLLIILLTFFPALLVILPLPARQNRADTALDRLVGRFLNWIIRLNLQHRKLTLTLAALLVAFCLAGIFRIQVETNPVGYFKPDVPVSRHFHEIHRELSGSFPIHVRLQGQGDYFFEQLENVRQIERFQQYVESLPGVDKSISFVDYLKLVNYVMNRYDAAYYRLPEEDFELRYLINNFKSILGDDMLERFMDSRLADANILLLTHISSSRQFLQTRERILSTVQRDYPERIHWEVTGLGMVISASSHLLVNGQVKSLGLTLILIFGIMVLLFLSSKVGVIAVAPNLFPIIVNFGLMGWLGVQLSVATSLVAGIAIGLAVDDTIHYLVRYNEEFKKDLDKDRAMRDTLLHVGRPILFTTITISIGFSILLGSHFQPTALFGAMMVVTMIAALVGDLILLPALMLHVELVTAWDLLKLIPTMGGMPPGLAHEINQPLNAIKVGSEFLKRGLQQGIDIKKDQLEMVVNAISSQVDRASELIRRLQDFGYRPHQPVEKIDLNEAVRSVLSLVQGQLAVDDIAVETALEENLPPILAHHNRLVQIFFNLIANAAEAIGEQSPEAESRRITIQTFSQKSWVSAIVTDTGVGIPEHVLDRIFEPFYTTKAVGKGKGLGLSITQEIVRDYGGRIRFRSRPGDGTSVKLSFPAA